MRVLIVATNQERAPIPVVPIGACIIAAVTEDAGHEVEVCDLMWERKPKRALSRALARFKPDVVGLSVRNLDSTAWLLSTFYLDVAKEYVKIVQDLGIPAVVGGACLGVHPGGITEYLGADAGVWGDGEKAWLELISRIDAGRPYEDVPGVVTVPAPGMPRVNPQFKVEELGEIVRPRVWRWIDYKHYARNSVPVPVQTRRGCVFECTYCTYTFIEGDSYRTKPIEEVVEEIAEAAELFPGCTIEFVDSTFNVPLPYTVKLLEALAERKLGVHLHTSGFNPKATSPRLIQAMNDAGFSQVIITPEAANEVMLDRLQKGFKVSHLIKCAELRKQGDWSVLWVFLLGGPGETEETLAETFAFIDEHVPRSDLVFLQPGLRVYPNTQLQRDAISEGVLDPDDPLIKPFYYLSPQISETRYREILVEQIKLNPHFTTIKDVLHPLYPAVLRIAGAMKSSRPMGAAPLGLSQLAKIGLRRPWASV